MRKQTVILISNTATRLLDSQNHSFIFCFEHCDHGLAMNYFGVSVGEEDTRSRFIFSVARSKVPTRL
jgi:hypothetical protein